MGSVMRFCFFRSKRFRLILCLTVLEIVLLLLLTIDTSPAQYHPAYSSSNNDTYNESSQSFEVLLREKINGVHTSNNDGEDGNREEEELYDSVDDSSEGVLPVPYFMRPDPHSPGGQVRVLIGVMATRMSYASCMGVASAFLSGIPAAIIGLHQSYTHVQKWPLTMSAARTAGLTSHDIVLYLDADVVFADSAHLLAIIDKFIAESASTPQELDPIAVREGRAFAPVTFGREKHVAADQLYEFPGGNRVLEQLSRTCNESAVANNMTLFVKTLGSINAGTMLARMWAFEEVLDSYYTYLKINPKPRRAGISWRCDQSILIDMYMDLRRWESAQYAVLTGITAWRSTYGLRAGVMGVDELNEISVVFTEGKFRRSNKVWDDNIDNNTDNKNQSRGVATVDKQAAEAGAERMMESAYKMYTGPLERVPLPVLMPDGTYSTADSEHYVEMAPHFAFIDRGGVADIPETRGIVPITHMAGLWLGHLSRKANLYGWRSSLGKLSKMTYGLHITPWFFPIRYDADRMAAAQQYLSQLEFAALSATEHRGMAYKDVCMSAQFKRLPSSSHSFLLQDALKLFFNHT